MRIRVKLFGLSVLLILSFASSASANLSRYMYLYDISMLEWQLLNWAAAWHGTTTPADPFVLERMEYDRKERKINIYLSGAPDKKTDDNLKKSIDNISSNIQQRFPEFDPKSDLIAHYSFGSFACEYKDGTFRDSNSSVQESKW